MKKVKSILILAAIASLIYFVAPPDALTQMGAGVPCCYNVPVDSVTPGD